MADIDNLTIKITAEANAAITALRGLASALGAVNKQLDRLDPSRMKGFADAADSVNKSMEGLGKSAENLKGINSELGKVSRTAGNMAKVGNAAQNLEKRAGKADGQLRKMTRDLAEVSRTASNSGSSGLKGIGKSILNMGKAVASTSGRLGLLNKAFKFVFGTITMPMRLATKAVKGLGKANDATTKTAKTLAKELTRVSKMLKLMVTRMALRAVIKEVGNGFKSLAIHSEAFNQSVSGMMNGAKKLGYSFAAMVSPLINALAPAIQYVINLLVKLANIINQVFSALSGAGSWNRAKDFTNNWADDIKSANKQAKELKKTVLGFDELNQLQEKYTSGGDTSGNITDMFETLPVEDKWKKVADTIKKYAKKFFEPIKKAWEKVGDFVKKSWKYAMNEVLTLGKSVARDFWKVWEQEKTQKIFENIFKIIGWIGQAVGNLAKRFREAWDNNNTGLHILENIRDIVLIVTESFEKMAKATADWADSLDFSPILEKFNEWLESCETPVKALMGIISDFYETVILPLGKWAIEEGGPQLLQVFIDFNKEVKWDELRTKLQKLWESLEPFAKKVGTGLIMFINDCAQALAKGLNSEEFENFIDAVCKWMDNVDAEEVSEGLKKFAKAILAFEIGKAVVNGLVAVATFCKTIAALAPLIKLAVIVTVALEGIEAGKTLGSMIFPDDKELYDGYSGITGTFKMIKDTVVGIVDWIKNYVETGLDAIVKEINFKVTLVKEGVKGVFGKGDIDEVAKAYNARNMAYRKHAIWNPTLDADKFNTNLKMIGEDAEEWARVIAKIDEAKEKISETGGEFEKTTGKAAGFSNTVKDLGDKYDGFGTAVNKLSDSAKNADEKFLATRNSMQGVSGETDKAVKSQKDFIAELSKAKTASDGISVSYKTQKGDAESLNKVLEQGKEAYKNIKTGMEQPVNYAPVFNSSQKTISDSLKNLGTATENFAATNEVSWTNVDTAVANSSGVFDKNIYQIQECVKKGTDDITKQTDTISKAFSEDKWTFSGVWKGLENTFKKAKESIKGIWNSIADKVNGKHLFGSERLEINLPKFAGGGFPKENGLFLANSTEMVGRFSNGKTAVANNAQIVEGISAGVYNAVSAAMASSNSGNAGYIANTIVVDGEVIARTITKAQEKQQLRFSPQMG